MKSRWLLFVILAGYGVLATAYMFATPLWEAPDEVAHYLYAEHIALNNRLPPALPPQRGRFFQNNYAASGYEWAQPPLYYGMTAVVLKTARLFRPAAFPQPAAEIDPRFPLSINLFVPLVSNRRFPCEVAVGPCVARLFSIPLGMLTLIGVWKLADVVSKGDTVVVAFATAFVAVLPQFNFLTSHVTNDNLANALAALSFWVMASWIERVDSFSKWRLWGGSVVVALGIVAKYTLLFLLPLGWLALWMSLPAPRRWRSWVVRCGLFTFLAISPILLGWAISPMFRLQLERTNLALMPKPQYLNFAHLLTLWPLTTASLWGRFGWMNVALPLGLTNILTGVAGVGLVGALMLLIKRRSSDVFVALRKFLGAICFLVLAGFVRFNLSDFQPQGRYLFPALPALATLISLGWCGWFKDKTQIMVSSLLIGGLLAANLYALGWVLLPAYAP